jgi:hypothetical protein
MNRYTIKSKVKVKYWSAEFEGKERELITTELDLYVPKLYRINTLHPNIEKIEYEILGGLVIMPLTLDHIDLAQVMDLPATNIVTLVKYYKKQNRLKSKLIITQVLPGSYIRTSDTIKQGAVIKEINGYPVNTLEQYRDYVLRYYSKNGENYVTIKTENDIYVVLTLKNIEKDEKFLSDKYKLKHKSIIGMPKKDRFLYKITSS